MIMSKKLTLNLEHSKYVWFILLFIQIHKFLKIVIIVIYDSSDSNHSSKCTVYVVVAFTRKEERKQQRQQAKQTHNLLMNNIVFVCESYSFYDSYKFRIIESWNQQHHKYC